MGSGIQATVKANELSLVMTVSRHGFHNGVMAYILQIGGSTMIMDQSEGSVKALHQGVGLCQILKKN